jgi:hypothetical protein
VILWLWWACSGTDPELAATARAVTAWEAGCKKLEAKDHQGALALFEEAARLRPSPLIDAWQAQAMASAGDVQGAVTLLDKVLSARPKFAQARYNRAAYLARLGRLPEAAQDLKLALEDGARKPVEVLEDPDFAPHLAHEAFGFLPQEALVVTVEAPPPTAFWGAEVVLGLTVSGLLRPELTIESAAGEGPIELVSVTEEPMVTGEGAQVRLEYRWRVLGAGPIVLGPVVFGSGKSRVTAEPVRVAAEAPPDKVAPQIEPVSFPLPSRYASQVPLGTAAKVDGVLVVHVGQGDRIMTEPALGPAARIEVRQGDTATEVLHRYRAGAQVHRVRIVSSDGTVRFDGPPSG